MTAAIIEVAINGITSKAQNPHVPISPGEIAREAICCLKNGAAIIHNHNQDIRLTGEAAGSSYAAGWRPVLAEFPEAILCPTTTIAPNVEDRLTYLPTCAGHGARMGPIDPGSVNLVSTAPDGSPGSNRFTYVNSFNDLDATLAEMKSAKLGPSIAIYDPSFLRATLAYHRAGKLPAGAMVKFYFGGENDFFIEAQSNAVRFSAVSFGLPPTRKSLEAYLDMLEGSNLAWSVAVLGGDVVESGVARLALENGGHVRVGLEDYAGNGTPTNIELLEAALSECRLVGRAPATCVEAAEILNLPHRA